MTEKIAPIGMDEEGLKPTRNLMRVIKQLEAGMSPAQFRQIKNLPVAGGIRAAEYVKTRLQLGNLERRGNYLVDTQSDSRV